MRDSSAHVARELWRFWGLSPYDRVRAVLALNLVPCGIRQLAALARVSPQTAKRVGDDLVTGRQAYRIRHQRTRTVRYLLRKKALREFREQLGRLPLDRREDQMAFLASTDAPIWILGPADYRPYVRRGIPEFVAIPRTWLHLVPHPRPYVTFESAGPLERNRDELPPRELLIALLKLAAAHGIGPFVARAMYRQLALRGRAWEGLVRRIRQEHLVAVAQREGIPVP